MIYYTVSNIIADSDNSDINEFLSSTYAKRTKKKKNRFINEHVVTTLDGIGLTDRQAVRIISAVAQALGFDLDELVISRQTIRRIRIKNRETIAKRVKEQFKVN